MIDIFQIGTIRRLPLGTDYNNVVAIVHELLRRCPPGTDLVIDGTGIGKAVADMFKFRGVTPWCVTATAGIEQTVDRANRVASVPKLMLISRLQSLLFEQRLKISADLEEAMAFLEELRDFRVEYSASGSMTYNAKSGRHDDMVSAAAVAAWRLTDGSGGMGPPSEYLAAVMLGIASQVPRPTPWAVGVDLGKVNDPTAIVVMRRISVDAPEFSALAEAATMPMGAVPEIPDAPPPVPLGTGPSVEDERERFRAMLDGRRPTANEICKHEAKLLVITKERGNKTDELLRREAMGATPGHPDVPAAVTFEAVNGRNLRPTYAPGSLEHAKQQEGKNHA